MKPKVNTLFLTRQSEVQYYHILFWWGEDLYSRRKSWGFVEEFEEKKNNH